MRRILVDVDTQIDFMKWSGALYVQDPTDYAIDNIRRKLREAQAAGDPIVGSVDSHAYDAWEFAANGGPFPPHCVKGTPGWLRYWHDVPTKQRFIPMHLPVFGSMLYVTASKNEAIPQTYGANQLAHQALQGVGMYFEKEVYSLFSNPGASDVIKALVAQMGGTSNVTFDVMGYCTGGYCVDAAARGLRERGYNVRVLGTATVAIGGEAAQRLSKEQLAQIGVEWVDDPGA